MKPSEYILLKACTFAYHCTRLSSQIRKVLTSNSDLVLATYSSVLQQMDEAEKIWSSSYDPAQPAASSIAVHAYQANFQLHLSASVLAFLLRTGQAGCSYQQHVHSTAMQERCIAAFRDTATRILHVQGMTQGIDDLPSSRFNIGWADAVMVYGSLRTIATSSISLSWQRNTANRFNAMIKERLGFQLFL